MINAQSERNEEIYDYFTIPFLKVIIKHSPRVNHQTKKTYKSFPKLCNA